MQTDPHERGSSMQQEPTNDTASAGAVYVQTNAAPNEVIAFRRADDGSLDQAFLVSVRHLAEPHHLDLSILHGDGSNTVAKKGLRHWLLQPQAPKR